MNNNPKASWQEWTRFALRWAITLAIIVAAGRRVWFEKAKLASYTVSPSPPWLIVSGAFYLVGLATCAVFWWSAMRDMGGRPTGQAPGCVLRRAACEVRARKGSCSSGQSHDGEGSWCGNRSSGNHRRAGNFFDDGYRRDCLNLDFAGCGRPSPRIAPGGFRGAGAGTWAWSPCRLLFPGWDRW